MNPFFPFFSLENMQLGHTKLWDFAASQQPDHLTSVCGMHDEVFSSFKHVPFCPFEPCLTITNVACEFHHP
jgi:hypothetical protein